MEFYEASTEITPETWDSTTARIRSMATERVSGTEGVEGKKACD